MPAKITISMDISKPLRKMDVAPKEVDQAIAAGIRKAAFLVEHEAKMDSPVDNGRLHSSIASDIFPMEATIEPHTNYAIFVHDGTRFMNPRPFMISGARRAENQFQEIFETELQKYV